MANKKQTNGAVFLLKTIGVYLVWIVVRKSMKGVGFLKPIWAGMNDWLANSYIEIAHYILTNLLGYESLRHNARNILIPNVQALYVGDHCLGIAAMFVFTFIILVLNGKMLHKVGFIIGGLLLIVFVNLFRIVSLTMMLESDAQSFFHFNHKYTYLVMVYGIIFMLIMFWEKRFAYKT